jgi:hypothetical protein
MWLLRWREEAMATRKKKTGKGARASGYRTHEPVAGRPGVAACGFRTMGNNWRGPSEGPTCKHCSREVAKCAAPGSAGVLPWGSFHGTV